MLRNWLRERRAFRREGPRRGSNSHVRLERLEDRIAPAILPPDVASQISDAVLLKVPQLISGSLTNAANIPILGSALSRSLTTDQLGQKLAQQVSDAIKDPKGQHYNDDGAFPVATTLVDAVHASATEQVPFAL